jgi:hypothetical protein
MLDEELDSQGGLEEEEETSEEESEETQDTEQETETAPEETEEEPEEESDDDFDLDDDTLAAIVEVYGDKITSSEAVQKLVDERANRQAQQRLDEGRRGQQRTSEVQQIIDKGKSSVQKVAEFINGAEGNYGKLKALAKEEELEFSGPDQLFNSQELGSAIQDYGMAMSAESTLRYERALDGAFGETLADLAPDGLTPKETEKLETIVNNAQRMRGDTAQSQDEAVGYFLKEVMSFVSSKAAEKGAAQEKARSLKRKEVGSKIANKNAVKAAKAKLAKTKLAPKSPKGKETTGGTGGTLMEQYRKAKEAKDVDEIDRISREILQERRNMTFAT